MRKSVKIGGVAAAATALAVVGFASPATAKGTPGEHSSAWVCGAASGGSEVDNTAWVSAYCYTKSGSGRVEATWFPGGDTEQMLVEDSYPNGYHTYVYLTVEGHSADLPVHSGQTSEWFSFHYAEDLNVNFWVCSSAQDNAACSSRRYTHT